MGGFENDRINGTGGCQFGQSAESNDVTAVLKQPVQRDSVLRWEFQWSSWSEKFPG
jgi:hypothetical protein